MKKSCNRNRRGYQQTEPACGLLADDATQAEIDTGRQTDGQHRTNKLPRRQAEKDGFPVRADFFWNFDFYKNRLRFVENLTEFLGYEIIFIGKNLTKRRKCYELYTHFIQGNRSPVAIRILWKLRLLPLGCYFVATKLFWPRWAAAHKTACILIFVACVLFFVLCWTIRYIRQKREEQIMAEFLHYYTKDLKPGESRTLEFL